ncbi:MAG: hypothetical protein H6981_08235 [Gammaproteobacteria bacterium]|nr:hypothetical protein [Gammaproteobacteria bacterium]MCP5136774.1 hypothetical protein [Gammaproteobacteria bacterium]
MLSERFLWGLGVFSVVMFVGSLVAVPFAVARIPDNYFTHEHREHDRRGDRHPVVRAFLVIAKNLLGALFFLIGFILLFLPGQGILAMVLGVLLMDFPGKYALEQRLVGNDTVFNALNWLRARSRKPPLQRSV